MQLISAVGGPIIAGFFGWIVGARNDGTSRENVYADHTREMWDRMDQLNNKLDKVTRERDDLKNQLIAMRVQVKKLQDSINRLMEDNKNE